jgi:rare lipoprotein A
MQSEPQFPRCLRALLVASLLAALAPAPVALAATGGAAAPGKPALGKRSKKARAAVATWFGPGFYGHQTACGQTLTPSVIGVANRTLPCGTLVRFTYGARTVTVPVLDRGPYGGVAQWDLTAGAARALAVKDTVRVAARVVGSEPNTPALGLPATPPAPVTPAPPTAPAPAPAVAGGAEAG